VKRIQQAFSFSNVIAMLALFLALGGSVYAASNRGRVNGARIKPKSLPGNRIKPRSLTGSQLKPGTVTGTQVKAGSLTGKQIVGSSLTGVAASSLGAVYYSVASATIPRGASSGTSAFAACPLGQKVIGGGATVSDDYASVSDSGPTADRNGWEATAWSGGDAVKVSVTAICTTVTTPTGSSGPAPRVPKYR
jgi:hypothetical protein